MVGGSQTGTRTAGVYSAMACLRGLILAAGLCLGLGGTGGAKQVAHPDKDGPSDRPPRGFGYYKIVGGYDPAKGDVTVAGSYTSPNGIKIDVAGLCTISDRSVTCRHLDGTAYDDMAVRIRAALAHVDTKADLPWITNANHPKVRVILFRATYPSDPRFTGGISITQVGGAGEFCKVPINNPGFGPEKPQSLCALWGATPDNKGTTTAELNFIEPCDECRRSHS